MDLRTDRLRLRNFVESDWQRMLDIESDVATVHYQSYAPRTADDCRAYIARDLASRSAMEDRSCFDLAVTLAEDGRFVGRIGLDIKRPERELGELWFVLDRALWGHGLMPEAARRMMDYGFQQKHLRRIFLECDPRNTATIRLAEKLGMKREGHLREHAFIKGEWCDALYFGLLHREASAGTTVGP